MGRTAWRAWDALFVSTTPPDDTPHTRPHSPTTCPLNHYIYLFSHLSYNRPLRTTQLAHKYLVAYMAQKLEM